MEKVFKIINNILLGIFDKFSKESKNVNLEFKMK